VPCSLSASLRGNPQVLLDLQNAEEVLQKRLKRGLLWLTLKLRLTQRFEMHHPARIAANRPALSKPLPASCCCKRNQAIY
jgi:hypothetical protein